MPGSFRWPIYWEYKENFPSSVKRQMKEQLFQQKAT